MVVCLMSPPANGRSAFTYLRLQHICRSQCEQGGGPTRGLFQALWNLREGSLIALEFTVSPSEWVVDYICNVVCVMVADILTLSILISTFFARLGWRGACCLHLPSPLSNKTTSVAMWQPSIMSSTYFYLIQIFLLFLLNKYDIK